MQLTSDYTAVEVTNLTKTFKGRQALRQVSFKIKNGEMTALIGASGSGKSTLLRNLNGLQQATEGSVKLYGFPLQVDGRFHSKIRGLRSQTGFIFQQFNLVSRLTVLENVLVGALSQVPLLRSSFRLFTREERARALSALERVGILDQAYKRTSLLSGGQQQRVAIARCLMQGAKIILADEPIASLDPESARKVMELLTNLNREDGITIITSLHQVQMVQRFYERTIALRDGAVVFDGRTNELSDQNLDNIYGKAVEELVVRGHGEVHV